MPAVIAKCVVERYRTADGCRAVLRYYRDQTGHVVGLDTFDGPDRWSFRRVEDARKQWAELRGVLKALGYSRDEWPCEVEDRLARQDEEE